jgi:hypothetical protein
MYDYFRTWWIENNKKEEIVAPVRACIIPSEIGGSTTTLKER